MITASPVSQWPIASQASCSSRCPAALKIAPHTPPPGARRELAAFTIQSTQRLVISRFSIENVFRVAGYSCFWAALTSVANGTASAPLTVIFATVFPNSVMWKVPILLFSNRAIFRKSEMTASNTVSYLRWPLLGYISFLSGSVISKYAVNHFRHSFLVCSVLSDK